MKLAWKIFCAAYSIVMLTVGVGGFVLVEATAASLVDSRVDSVLTANATAARMFVVLAEKSPDKAVRTQAIQRQVAAMADTATTDKLSIGVISVGIAQSPYALVNRLEPSQQGYAFIAVDEAAVQEGVTVRADAPETDVETTGDAPANWLQAVCRVTVNDDPFYVETLSDFSDVFAQRDRLIRLYRTVVLAVALLSGVVLLGVSLAVAWPLKRLSRVANQIAAGDLGKRIPLGRHSMGSAEIRRLSADFNTMAQAVEDNIGSLQREVDKRETFIADFTHELKTPMTSIIGYADMLRSYALDESERREAADAIYREGRRLERLSMQLLDILVLEKDTIDLRAVHTAALFDELRQALRFLEKKYGVAVQVQADAAVVRGEPTLLLSLLYNLVDNACKASSAVSNACKASPAVTVTGIQEGGRYRVVVADNGCGIAPENRDRVMEPFFREDKARSRRQGGAGLGLALCSRIAALHGTALEIDSLPGQGTTVRLELAVEDTQVPREGETP